MSVIVQQSEQPIKYKYKAFISYKRDPDAKIAAALQSALHRIGRPWYKPYAVRVFRDKTDIGLSHQLWATIQKGLEQSEYFILLASPEAATNSPWIEKEITYWVTHRKIADLLIVRVDGQIVWGASACNLELTTALPKLLAEKYTEEPGWLDLSWARTSEDLSLRQPQFKDASSELSAILQGKEKADVLSEDVRQWRRTRRLAWTAVITLIALLLASIGTAVYAFQQRNSAVAARKAESEQRLKADASAKEANEQRDNAVAAQGKEKIAREAEAKAANEALQQRDEAKRQKEEAQNQTIIAEQRRREVEQTSYVTNMNLALREFEAHNYPRGHELLNSYLPPANQEDKRDFSWYLLWKNYHDEKQTLSGHGNSVGSVAWSADGRTLASGGSGSKIKLWDVARGKELRTLSGHGHNVFSVAWSPDGRTLASDNSDKTITLWDATSGKELRTLSGHGNSVWSVAWSADGRTLASGSDDKTIKLWDAASGKELRTLSGHGNRVWSVAWSADGRTLASGSYDNTIKLWDVASGKELRTLRGHGSFVNSVAWSPDGRTLSSGSTDKTIILWSAATDTEVWEHTPPDQLHQRSKVQAAKSRQR